MLFCTKGKNAVFRFIMSIFKEYEYCRSVMKKHEENAENEEFERSNICVVG